MFGRRDRQGVRVIHGNWIRDKIEGRVGSVSEEVGFYTTSQVLAGLELCLRLVGRFICDDSCTPLAARARASWCVSIWCDMRKGRLNGDKLAAGERRVQGQEGTSGGFTNVVVRASEEWGRERRCRGPPPSELQKIEEDIVWAKLVEHEILLYS